MISSPTIPMEAAAILGRDQQDLLTAVSRLAGERCLLGSERAGGRGEATGSRQPS